MPNFSETPWVNELQSLQNPVTFFPSDVSAIFKE